MLDHTFARVPHYVPASGGLVNDGLWHLEHLIVDHQPKEAIQRKDTLGKGEFAHATKYLPLRNRKPEKGDFGIQTLEV